MTTGVTAGSIASASAVGVVPQLDFADTAVVSHAIRFSEGGQNCSRQRALNRCPLLGLLGWPLPRIRRNGHRMQVRQHGIQAPGHLGVDLEMRRPDHVDPDSDCAAIDGPPPAVSGPYAVPLPPGGYDCIWLVYLHGVGAGNDVEWSADWEDADGAESGSVVMLPTELFTAPLPAVVVGSYSGSIEWIDVWATVDGQRTPAVRVQCLI